jgi:predicted small secreted protein
VGFAVRGKLVLRASVLAALCGLTAGCIPGLPGLGEDVTEASLAPTDAASRITRSGGGKSSLLGPLDPPVGAVDSQTAVRGGGWGTQQVAVRPDAAPPRDAEEPQVFVEAPIAPPSVALARFYAALAALADGSRTEPVTILHLGDDHIAMDQFTGDLRAQFQSRFGDAGRGLLPPGVFPAQGVKFDRGGNWRLMSSAANDAGLFGLTGLRMEAADRDAWVRLNYLRGNFDWLEVTFGTAPGSGTAILSVDGDAKLIPTSDTQPGRAGVRIAGKGREVVIRPRGDGPIALLSVAAGLDRPGIRYVNLGLPGATVATPGKWNVSFMAADLQALKPDLVILSYGARDGFVDALDLREFEVRVRLLMEQIQDYAPGASFMVLGPPDAARLPAFATAGGQACRALSASEVAQYRRMMRSEDRRLARWHAPPKFDGVRHTLRNVASAKQAYFWDWARMMGGSCSIHAWATANPPLAAPDRMMLTPAGAERSARALFIELMNGYETYRQTAVAAPKPAPAPAGNKQRAAERPAQRRTN